MKLRYIILIVLGVLYGLHLLAVERQNAYDACVKAGKQSNETCNTYTL